MKSEGTEVEEEEALRNCSCELSILSQCDGSATLCNGPAAVLAGTFGPVEVRPQRELVDRAHIEVSFRGHCGVDAVEHRHVEQVVRATLQECVHTTLHPRTCVCVSLTVLETDPLLLLSTCINAACLALLDSSLQMKFVPAAVTCVPCGDRVLVNPLPADRQENAPAASVTAVYNTASGDVLSVLASGPMTPDQLSSCLEEGKRAARQVTALYRQAVKSKFCKEPREPWAPPSRAEDSSVAWQRPGTNLQAEKDAEMEA